jgi:calcium-dependent protein kinase
LLRYILTRAKPAEFVSEFVARFILYQLLSAVYYLHNDLHEPIIHRDIKPDNILVFHEVPVEHGGTTFMVPFCKLTDFGSARVIPPEVFLRGSALLTQDGTRDYMAPELWEADGRRAVYGPKVDIYALGLTLFNILTANSALIRPGETRTDALLRRRAAAHDLYWEALFTARISEDGRDLLRWMTTPDPDLRLSAAQCLAHPWFDGIREQGAAAFGHLDFERFRRAKR